MFYEVIPKKVFHQDAGLLTYRSDIELLPGQIVSIPLGKAESIGLVYKKVAQPNFPTKTISKIIYSTPLPHHLLKLLDFLHDYYLVSYQSALALVLPQGIEKHRHASSKTEQPHILTPKLPIIDLNAAQKMALEGLKTAPESTKLLHGITGSGKTNIYLQMAKNALEAQNSTILLVPEIALTSQLVRVFEDTFGQNVTLIHSKQTEATRHKIWESLLSSDVPQIIIGPRSALFAPIHNLGLIIIDECHESTYYQENTPKYSTLRLASAIAKAQNIACILGSATPSVQDYYLAQSKKSLITLKEKAKKTAIEPEIKVIDFKSRENFTKNRYFSNAILSEIEDNLKNHHQTLIFHNRRGSAPLTLCENCGEDLLCPTCFLPLTLHTDSYELVCHACGHQEKVPHACPKCGSPNIIHKGFGTKLLESELNRLFKTARIARFDADNSKTDSLDVLYDDVKNGKIDIIIGTQTITKGLDLPNLATVGVVQADAGLSLPDYAAEEKTFELITQVIGRVGRGHLDKASVIIQTFKPDSPTINFAIKNDYDNFSNYILKKRKAQNFPPYSYLAKVEVIMKTESIALKKIRTIYNTLRKNPNLTLSVPTPAFHERTARGFTWQILIHARSRQKLLDALNQIPKDTSIHLTLDPPSILK